MSDINGRVTVNRNLAGGLMLAILVGGLLLILYLTLRPFGFQFRGLTVADYIAGYDIPPSSILDFPRNILLFMPVGFGTAAIFDQRGGSRSRVLLTVLICGFLLSLMVESLQQFLPTRQPAVADLIANTLGALAGFACFTLWQSIKETDDWLNQVTADPERVLAVLAIYALLLMSMAYMLSSSVRFYIWDTGYRMMLGNEQTGDRQWIGSVRDLVFFNRALEISQRRDLLNDPDLALSHSEGLLAYFPLGGGGTQRDVTGNQPGLIWQPEYETDIEQDVARFAGGNWLETKSAVSNLTEQLQQTSQLSVRLSVATDELEQIGPASILSIAEDPFLQNLMIGQEGNDLVMRARSPLTGEGGVKPEVLFPDFFTGSESIDFVAVFDGLAISLIDSRSQSVQSIEMIPGVAFYYAFLNPLEGQVPASAIYNWVYRLFFYILVLLPFAIPISLRTVKAWPQKYRLILILYTMFVIPLLLEMVLVYRSGSGIRPLNVAISVLVVAFIAWVFVPALLRLFDR